MKYILIILAVLAFSCTENQRTRSFGGTQTVKIETGYKLVTATWKQDDLWFLIEPMPKDYAPEIKYFYEDSSFGVMNGKVVFEEKR